MTSLKLVKIGTLRSGRSRVLWGCEANGYMYRCYSSSGAWVAQVIRQSDGVEVDSLIPAWSKAEAVEWLQARYEEVKA